MWLIIKWLITWNHSELLKYSLWLLDFLALCSHMRGLCSVCKPDVTAWITVTQHITSLGFTRHFHIWWNVDEQSTISVFQLLGNNSAVVLLRLFAAVVPRLATDNLSSEVGWPVATLLHKGHRFKCCLLMHLLITRLKMGHSAETMTIPM